MLDISDKKNPAVKALELFSKSTRIQDEELSAQINHLIKNLIKIGVSEGLKAKEISKSSYSSYIDEMTSPKMEGVYHGY